jgi:hypothetical protein
MHLPESEKISIDHSKKVRFLFPFTSAMSNVGEAMKEKGASSPSIRHQSLKFGSPDISIAVTDVGVRWGEVLYTGGTT